jgi:hypothetical protein
MNSAAIAHYSYLLSGGRADGRGLARATATRVRLRLRCASSCSGQADGPVPFHYPAARLLTQQLLGAEAADSVSGSAATRGSRE